MLGLFGICQRRSPRSGSLSPNRPLTPELRRQIHQYDDSRHRQNALIGVTWYTVP
jgi:hypothetical protein